VYLTVGARRIGISPRLLWNTVRLPVGVVALEAAVTGAVAAAVAGSGLSRAVALSAGALAGVLAVAAVGMYGGRAQKGAAGLRTALRGDT
jgi:hypothetical protein